MAIYGIGCNYDIGDVSNEFIEKGVACMDHDSEKMLYFTGLFNEIRKGDIIFLKSIDLQGHILIIKALGIVKNPNYGKKDNNLGYGIDVEWLIYKKGGIKEIGIYSDGGWQPRNTTIYREFNSEICDQIIEELITNK